MKGELGLEVASRHTLHVKHHVSECLTFLWGGLSTVVDGRISLFEVVTKALEEGHQLMSRER